MEVMKIALPEIVAERQNIDQVETKASAAGSFDWIFNVFSNVGSFFSGSGSTTLHNGATYLPTIVDAEMFVKYVGNMQVELCEASALTLDCVEVRADCMRRLRVMGIMKDHAKAWMEKNATYEFGAVNLTFQEVQALREKVMAAVSNVGEYTVPDAPLLDATLSISHVSPGITNGGNNCYLSSLLQGVIGDPITRQWIIDAEFVYDSPMSNVIEKQVREFVEVLKECTCEFEEAQRLGKKTPLLFIGKLRDALTPLIPSTERGGINLNSGSQEDPSEVLVAILAYLNPEGNPLFNTITEKLVFGVKDNQARKLADGARTLKTFKTHIETLKNQGAGQEMVEAGLKTYLTYLDPEGDYEAPDVDNPSKILKAILLKLNERTDKSFADQRSKAIHDAKITQIVSEGSLPILIAQVEELIANLQSIPQLVDTEWVKARSTESEGLRTLKINGNTKSNAFESFIEAAFNEESSKDNTGAPGMYVKYLDKTPDEVTLSATHSKYAFQTTPEHVFFALNRNAHSGNRSSAGSFKEMKKVHLEETFFLDPKFTEDKKGGKYQVRWFCIHQGTGDKGGHYVNYRLTEQGWYCLNDGSSNSAGAEEVEKALQDCCLIFANRTDQDLTKEQIQDGIEAAIEASHGKDNKLRYNEIKLRYNEIKRKRTVQSPDEREIELLPIFSNELSHKVPDVELLKNIFDSLEGTEFPGFVTEILTLKNLLAEAPIKNQLLQLKGIQDALLMVEINDHIVAQYVEVRKQRRQHALDAIALENITESSLRAAEERFEKIKNGLTYENQCLGHILSREGLNKEGSLFLLKTLSSSLAEKYEALLGSSEENLPIAERLEQLVKRNNPHIAKAKKQLKAIQALGSQFTTQANTLTSAVKAEEVPVPQPRREVRRDVERGRSKSVPPPTRSETNTHSHESVQSAQ